MWLPSELPNQPVAGGIVLGNDQPEQVSPVAHFGQGDLQAPHGIAVEQRFQRLCGR